MAIKTLKFGLQPSFSHHSCCLNCIHEWWGTYSLTTTEFLRSLSMAGLLYSQRFCLKSAERKSQKKYFFFSYFCYVSRLKMSLKNSAGFMVQYCLKNIWRIKWNVSYDLRFDFTLRRSNKNTKKDALKWGLKMGSPSSHMEKTKNKETVSKIAAIGRN